jgi:predicted RNA-binding Zn-ribbon protein involved in translation (DUF1610 family)
MNGRKGMNFYGGKRDAEPIVQPLCSCGHIDLAHNGEERCLYSGCTCQAFAPTGAEGSPAPLQNAVHCTACAWVGDRVLGSTGQHHACPRCGRLGTLERRARRSRHATNKARRAA